MWGAVGWVGRWRGGEKGCVGGEGGRKGSLDAEWPGPVSSLSLSLSLSLCGIVFYMSTLSLPLSLSLSLSVFLFFSGYAAQESFS